MAAMRNKMKRGDSFEDNTSASASASASDCCWMETPLLRALCAG
jgi:hypothetical protein